MLRVRDRHPGRAKATSSRLNIAQRTATDGINVAAAGTTIALNLALHNGDLGIEAVHGVRDGGGNRASGNGNSAQCVGVSCARGHGSPNASAISS